jgi:hypothetical protein
LLEKTLGERDRGAQQPRRTAGAKGFPGKFILCCQLRRATSERTPKLSASFYRKVIARNALA